MRRIFFASALAALASAVSTASAQAADLGPPRSMPAPEAYVAPTGNFSWRGFYAGLNGGYAWGSGDPIIVTQGLTTGALEAIDPSGFFGGGQIGYNAQFGSFVLGVEADLQGGAIDGSTSGTAGALGPFTASSEVNWLSTVRARAGLAADRMLIYATGGVAWADMDFRLSDGVNTFSGNDTLTGYAVGAGVEWALGLNWTARAEYLYVDLEDAKFSGGGTSASFDNSFHTMRAGLNYKF